MTEIDLAQVLKSDDSTIPRRVENEEDLEYAQMELESTFSASSNFYPVLEEQPSTSISNLINLTVENPIYDIERPIISQYVSNSIYSNTLRINFPIKTKVRIVETFNSLKLYYKPAAHSYN